LPALFVVLAGCAAIPVQVGQLEADTASLELVGTPFYPQERYQCGPAALATVLASSGAAADLGTLVDRVYIPGKKGSLQVEMLAASRTAGRIPYVVDGTLQTLRDELNAGRPVVVLQNLGVAAIPRWHYAVVVGIDAERDQVVLRSGTDKRRITRTRTFLRTWQRGSYWAFVVLRPGELPSRVDRGRYLQAVADLERAGRDVEAATAWQAALAAWPGDAVALFGLGNAQLAAGNNAAAEQYFRAILERNPASAVARNNLAIALARQSRFADARNEIATATDDNDDPALESELEDTAALIEDLARH
jgi:hypothetical protein